MTSFNLIDEPWIPCITGDEVSELGLRDVLSRAQDIDALAGLSPPESVAVHRLLLALLQSIYRPMDEDHWQELWDAGLLDNEVNDYLDRWHHRFDLFDDERPFYQVAALPFEPYERSAVNLTLEWGAGNQRFFSHAPPEHPFTPAEAARHLLTYQAFASGGLVTHEQGKLPDKFADAAPLNRGAVGLVQGGSLFETLLLNAIDYDASAKTPDNTEADDKPVWEDGEVARPVDRTPLGYLDWLTWQARRVRLHPVDERGKIVVRQAVAMKGFQLPTGVYAHEYETMVAYREQKKAKPGENPYLPIGFSPGRALWRDSLVLFESAGGKQPRTLRELSNRPLDGTTIWPLALAGIAGDRAIVTLWRQETLPLPHVYLEDRDLRAHLKTAVTLVDAVGRAVRDAAETLASWLVAPDQDQPGAMKADQKAVTALREQMAVEETFWPRLERPFVEYLVAQALAGYEMQPLREWAGIVRRAARRSLDSGIDGLDLDARSIRAGVEANARLRRALGVIWKQEVKLHELTHA